MTTATRSAYVKSVNTDPVHRDSAHFQRWLDRYGDDYETDAERHAGYRQAVAALAELRSIFADDRSGPVPLPPGFTHADGWQSSGGKLPCRVVLGAERAVSDSSVRVSVAAVQFACGSVRLHGWSKRVDLVVSNYFPSSLFILRGHRGWSAEISIVLVRAARLESGMRRRGGERRIHVRCESSHR